MHRLQLIGFASVVLGLLILFFLREPLYTLIVVLLNLIGIVIGILLVLIGAVLLLGGKVLGRRRTVALGLPVKLKRPLTDK